MKRKIKGEGFNILECGWEFKDYVVFYFIVEKKILPSTITLNGPPLSIKGNVKKFKEKHNIFPLRGEKRKTRWKQSFAASRRMVEKRVEKNSPLRGELVFFHQKRV